MVDIPMRTQKALDKDTLMSMNTWKTGQVYSAQNIEGLNRPAAQRSRSGTQIQRAAFEAADRGVHPGERAEQGMPVRGSIQRIPPQMQVPPLLHPVRKGQKVLLQTAGPVRQADVCLGWNSMDARCDVDVSAFLLGENGKVIGDDWFVFYGQTKSPDGSTVFEMDGAADREVIRLDFTKLNPSVKKIVFVLTIHEAAAKRLNFGMLRDAYIRILDHADRKELISFRMTEYYSNVISMMIGELYLYNGNWKFHGIGNGVAKDLAGLCGLYGVQVSG